MTTQELQVVGPIRSYRLKRAKGPILLACGKCQKRLKGDRNADGIVPLKKLLKGMSLEQGVRPPYVIKIPCLKLCPKGGIVVMTGKQVDLGECSIVRSSEDADAILEALHADK